MIIIEGGDCTGKSTLVKYIKEKTELRVIKPYFPKINQLSYYLHTPSMYSGSFLERYYLSELAYPQFKTGRNIMPPWAQFQIESAILPFSPVIIYLRPKKETIIKNLNNRGDDYITSNDIDLMLHFYDELIKKTFIPVINYDFEEDNISEKIDEALYRHHYMKAKAYELMPNLYTGSIEKNGIMIIGNNPSQEDIGNGYIRAFSSNSDNSSFIHKTLWDAGVYNNSMPYFTNWGKGFDNEDDSIRSFMREIEILNPRKIISFGVSIPKKLDLKYDKLYNLCKIDMLKNNDIYSYTQLVKEIKLLSENENK